MIYLISIKDIIEALIREVDQLFPSAEHYIGGIQEGYAVPCFLYLPVYQKQKRRNSFLQVAKAEIQMIYFGKRDYAGKEDFNEQAEVIEKLSAFFDAFLLQVKDRFLTFNYRLENADEHLSYFITLEYMEDAPIPSIRKDEAQEVAEKVYFKERVK